MKKNLLISLLVISLLSSVACGGRSNKTTAKQDHSISFTPTKKSRTPENVERHNLYSIFDNDRWGFINKEGQIVINPQFDYVENYVSDGLILARVGEKVGYIDATTGTFVINPQFDGANTFSEGLAGVGVVVETTHDFWSGKDEKIVKWGFIDRTGTFVINPQFDNVGYFFNGLAVVIVDDRWGYIDKTGKYVINPQFMLADNFGADIAPVAIDQHRFGFIDKTGKFVVNPTLAETHMSYDSGDYWSCFHEGLCGIKDNGWGYIDKTGKIVIPCQFDEAEPFSDGLALVKKYNDDSGMLEKKCFINKKGEEVLDVMGKYTQVGSFHEGLAAVFVRQQDGSERCGYINKKGEMVIQPCYTHAAPFCGGLAGVRYGDSYYYIDKTGKVIWAGHF